MAGQRAVLRLLLVVLVAVGVASMHTLGHPSSGGHGGAAQPAAHGGHEPAASDTAGQTMAVLAAGELVLRGMDLGLDPSTVCLAILVAFALVALLAALLAVRRRPRPPRQHRGAVAPAGRGPPLPVFLGLRLANLSVLRI